MAVEKPFFGRGGRRLLILATVVLTGYCDYAIVPHGGAREWVLAGICTSFPLAAWWEASRLRRRGLPAAADAVVAWAFAAVLGFAFLAGYAADMREGSVEWQR